MSKHAFEEPEDEEEWKDGPTFESDAAPVDERKNFAEFLLNLLGDDDDDCPDLDCSDDAVLRQIVEQRGSPFNSDLIDSLELGAPYDHPEVAELLEKIRALGAEGTFSRDELCHLYYTIMDPLVLLRGERRSGRCRELLEVMRSEEAKAGPLSWPPSDDWVLAEIEWIGILDEEMGRWMVEIGETALGELMQRDRQAFKARCRIGEESLCGPRAPDPSWYQGDRSDAEYYYSDPPG